MSTCASVPAGQVTVVSVPLEPGTTIALSRIMPSSSMRRKRSSSTSSSPVTMISSSIFVMGSPSACRISPTVSVELTTEPITAELVVVVTCAVVLSDMVLSIMGAVVSVCIVVLVLYLE